MKRRGFIQFCICMMMVWMLLAGCGGQKADEPQKPAAPTAAPTEDLGYHAKPDAADGYVHSHAVGTTVCYDLNGDGIGEDITVNTREYEEGNLTIGGDTVEFYSATPTGYFTVLNLNTSRNVLLVGISDYGFSDDNMTILYAYDGTEIREVGFFDDIVGENAYGLKGAVCHGDGTISARTRLDVLGTWNASCRYYVDETGAWDITEFYQYEDWDGNRGGWEVTANVDLIMCDEIGNFDIKIVVPAGTQLRMDGASKSTEADSYWASFTVASIGKTYWMLTRKIDWQTYVQTDDVLIASEEAFDGFYYAG